MPEAEPIFELEIDGKKETMTHTQARTRLQKSGALDKRIQAAAESQKSVESLKQLAESDPEEFLRKVGKDPQKILEGLLARKAKDALLTPEQRERAKEQEELATLKADKEKAAKEKADAATKEQTERHETALREQLVAVADKYNLDREPEVLAGLCEVAEDLLETLEGVVPTLDQIAQEYMRREAEHIDAREKKRTGKLEGDKLLAYLGEELLKKIDAARDAKRAASLKTIPAPVLKVKTTEKPLPPRAEGGRFIREVDFDKKAGLRR